MTRRWIGDLNQEWQTLVKNMRPPMLYHYTAIQHAMTIVDTGYLKTVESNISPYREHAGPDVVWFTSTPNPLGIGVTPGVKDAVEIGVPTPTDARCWPQWAREHGMDEDWFDVMTNAAGVRDGGTPNPGLWWVVERRVEASEIAYIKIDGQEWSRSDWND